MGNFKAHRQLEFQKEEASLGQKSFEERDLKFAKSDEKRFYWFQKISKSQTR